MERRPLISFPETRPQTQKEELILEDLTAQVDRWLRREDTWLAKGLANISENRIGLEYRNSKIKERADRAMAGFYAVGTIPITGAIRAAAFVSNKLNLEDAGPFYYIQERVGERGEKVKIKKIRSMRKGADADTVRSILTTQGFLPEDDPRNTKMGGVIRAVEADEFPQILQALRGEISLTDTRMIPQYAINHILEERPKTGPGWIKIYLVSQSGLFNLNSAINQDRKDHLKRYHLDMFWARKASLGLHLFIHYRTWLRMVRKVEKKIRGL